MAVLSRDTVRVLSPVVLQTCDDSDSLADTTHALDDHAFRRAFSPRTGNPAHHLRETQLLGPVSLSSVLVSLFRHRVSSFYFVVESRSFSRSGSAALS